MEIQCKISTLDHEKFYRELISEWPCFGFLFTVIDLTIYDDALNRVLAHNGEINTLRGNVNLMRAREGVMHSQVYGDQLKKLYPVVEEGMTDSGCVDNALEFLCMAGGRELPEVRRGVGLL